MHKKENRKFADDPWDVAVARTVFTKWMKSRGLWGGYLKHLGDNPDCIERAWRVPHDIVDFLGECGYEYFKAYLPWDEYCVRLKNDIKNHIKFEQDGYTKDCQGC